MPRSSRKILLGVSGSIAAEKSPEIVRLLVDNGHEVQCVLTEGATEFVAPLVLATFSRRPIYHKVFGASAYQLPHIVHSENADIFVIAPATATMLAHLALGLADDMVSLCYLNTKAPVLIAPAMHPAMWEHPATQANVKILRGRGVQFIGPYSGPLADKSHGEGRMSEPEEIADIVEKILKK